MKKSVKILLLFAALAAITCLSVFATDGAFDVTLENAFSSTLTVTPKTADGTAITADGGFYEGAEKFDITYSAATNEDFYLLLVLNAEGVPTESSIVYIDQVTADGTSVSFTAYPSALENDTTYYIYLSSNDGMGYQKAASFTYGENTVTPPPAPSFVFGDVNGDDEVLINDATRLLNFIAGNVTLSETELLAADVTHDNEVLINDATRILNFIAGNVTSFDD